MKKINIYLSLLCILLLCGIGFTAKSQTSSKAQIRSVFTFRFAQNIDWPNESKLTKFRIGVLGSNAEYKELKKIQGKKLKGKPIEVIKFGSINEITKTEILYVANDKVSDMQRIFSKVNGTQTLLVSDNCANQKKVMLNFIYLANNKITFEMHKPNIINEQLTVSSKMVLLGGSDIDIAVLVKESEKNLGEERKKVREKSAQIKDQQNKINKQTKAIESQLAEISTQKEEITIQKAEISTQKEKLSELLADINVKEKALQAKIDTLEVQEERIKLQEKKMTAQEQELIIQNKQISERSKELNTLTADVEVQQERLTTARREIAKAAATIAIQKYLIYIFIVFLLLVGGLAYFIYRSYKIKQEINKQLEAKNAEISQQKEEIQAQSEHVKKQAETLTVTNHELEIEKEIRESSIRYGLTIQQAILPYKKELDKAFNSFVIFRPKDVVSGDFYWFHKVKATATQPQLILIAALDCTGHGVPGAFMSMIGSSLLNKIVKEKKIYNPSQILELLHKDVKMALKQEDSKNDDGMDVCLCCLEAMDEGKTKVTYTGAKRPLIVYKHKSSDIEISKGDIKSIGGKYYDEMAFSEQEMIYDKDDILYLTSDGYFDQNDKARKRFTMTRFFDLVKENAHLNIDEQKIVFEKALDKHQTGTNQRDDITVVGIKLPITKS